MSRLQFTTGAGGAPPWTFPPDVPNAFSQPAMSLSAKQISGIKRVQAQWVSPSVQVNLNHCARRPHT